MPTVEDVPCPCCNKVLYRAVKHENGLTTRQDTTQPLGNDVNGDFMTCPHCRKRIALENWIGPGGLASLRVSQDQDCA